MSVSDEKPPQLEAILENRGDRPPMVINTKEFWRLRVTLSTGVVVDVELLERTPGCLAIRGARNALAVLPQTSNTILIEGRP